VCHSHVRVACKSMSCKPINSAFCAAVAASMCIELPAAGMHAAAAYGFTQSYPAFLAKMASSSSSVYPCTMFPCSILLCLLLSHRSCPCFLCLSIFLMCKPRYKQLWQSLGFHNIVSARPPMSSIMMPAAGQLLAAKFTHRLLQTAQQRPNAPILVRSWS
jgi:hypothetical protein